LAVTSHRFRTIKICPKDAACVWRHSRPVNAGGVFIDKNDIIYVADSESESVAKDHDGWKEAFGSVESVMVS
jgi:hypothetical protein